MSSRWLRLYAEVYRDPKVCRLPDRMFKFWINCLCLAAENDGVIPSHTDIGFYLRISPIKALQNLTELKQAGLLDETPEKRFTPHNWDGRQYESDSSTERVKRFRKRFSGTDMKRFSNGTEQIQSRTDTEQNRTEQQQPQAVVVEFPKSTEFIESRFPGTGDRLVKQIVQRALQEVISAGEQPELVTDEVLLQALRECTRPKQYSAALYLETIPAWMKYMATSEAHE